MVMAETSTFGIFRDQNVCGRNVRAEMFVAEMSYIRHTEVWSNECQLSRVSMVQIWTLSDTYTTWETLTKTVSTEVRTNEHTNGKTKTRYPQHKCRGIIILGYLDLENAGYLPVTRT